MEINKPYIIKFSEGEEVIVSLDFVEEKDGIKKFQTIKYDYDLLLDEKSVLTITVETSPLTIQEKAFTMHYDWFYGKHRRSA